MSSTCSLRLLVITLMQFSLIACSTSAPQASPGPGAPAAPAPFTPTPTGPGPQTTLPRQPVEYGTPVKVTTAPLTARPTITAKRALVVDFETGRVLFQKNPDERVAVASTQKLLTALCIVEDGNLTKQVTVKPTDTRIEPTKLYLRAGETYQRRDLVRALLVKSGNDVAKVLARDNAGSQAEFSQVMNAKARSLGMYNSNFVNAHGLTEPGQFSTARDLSLLARECLKNPFIRDCIRTKEYTFRYSDGRTKQLKNTNKVLRRLAYCNGMKTGTTNASGRCLVSSGTLNGRTAIAIVLGATSATVWDESEALLKWALERPAAR